MSADTLKKFAAKLRELPRVVAIEVATASAPAITAASIETFMSGEDAYGVMWAPKEDGTRATLVDSGALSRRLAYVATGTKIRCKLGVQYAKYQLGKRPVFPRAGALLPRSYTDAIAEVTASVIKKEVAS